MQDTRRFECNAPDVIFEDFGDETILINLTSGCYYSLDAMGMKLWDLVLSGSTVSELLSRVVESYEGDPEEIQKEIQAFVELLLAEGLLRPTSEAQKLPERAAAAGAAGAFVSPTLSKHDDLEDILLLDPVHDVSEHGWPSPAVDTQTKP